jgi:hypothetical protein
VLDLDMALAYSDFVQARHGVWAARQAGLPPEQWTTDPILQERKFTNVYRVLDPGSQYVLTDLLEPGMPLEDFLLRCFLYRHTGRVEAWQWLELSCGLPTRENLDDVWEAWQQYRGPGVTKMKNLKPASERPNKAGGMTETSYARSMFTGAYLVFPQSQVPGTDKLKSIIDLTDRLFVKGDTAKEFLLSQSQAERFAALRRQKGVADFMSMQILTDFGYATEDSENDFVVCGPGAVRGAAALAPGTAPTEVVRMAHKMLQALPISIETEDGRHRAPSLMDAQNTLCEFSKYVREMGKPRTGRLYRPAHPGAQTAPLLPAAW